MNMNKTILASALNHQFGLPGLAEIVDGHGNLPKVRVSSPTARGEIYLHGAHVASWRPAGQADAFFVSRESRWQEGSAIRGGVPICFPWFGDKADDPKAPAHGFVRTKTWQLESIADRGSSVEVSLSTSSDSDTKQWTAADFRLALTASFGSELGFELTVSNTGASAFQFQEALHAYLNVGNVRQVRLQGLNSVHYLDKTDQNREKTQSEDVVISGETDRVYLDTANPVELVDPVLNRTVGITKSNSLTTVIWNPWIEKAKAMSDMADDEWQRMLCVETSNVLGYAVELAPGQRHVMTSIVSVRQSSRNA